MKDLVKWIYGFNNARIESKERQKKERDKLTEYAKNHKIDPNHTLNKLTKDNRIDYK